MVEFNVNDEVEVRLTPAGRAVFLAKERLLPEAHQRRLPNEVDGWSRFQLWDLFQTFGNHVRFAGELMFETNMRLVTDADYEARRMDRRRERERIEKGRCLQWVRR